MNLKLKRGIAVILPVMGIAVVGVVGAQALHEPLASPQRDLLLPEQQPASDMALDPVDTTAAAPAEPIVATPEPAPAAAPVMKPMPLPTERVVIALPPTVSSRSGEGSLEEIAVRTAPVDERAGSSPLYVVDQSPGGF